MTHVTWAWGLTKNIKKLNSASDLESGQTEQNTKRWQNDRESGCRNSGIGSRPYCDRYCLCCTRWARRACWRVRCDLCCCCGRNFPGFLTDLSSSWTRRKTIYQEIYKSSCSPWESLIVLSVWNRVTAWQCYLSRGEKPYLVIIGTTDNKIVLFQALPSILVLASLPGTVE